MEVMQYLKEEVDKKKEQVHHLKDDVKEKIEELLVARCGYERLHDAANNVTTVTVDESITRSSVAGSGHPDEKMKQPAVVEVDHNPDKSQKSVFLDESAGMWKCRQCIWTYQFGNSWVDHIHQKQCRDASQEGSHAENIPKGEAVTAKLKDVDIQKVLSAVINGQNMEILEQTFSSHSTLSPSKKLQEEDGSTSGGRIKNETKRLKIDVVDGSDEEVLELEFERAVEKMHKHEYNMYCPNCSSRITKVILRRRKREKRTQPQDLLGCLACFSIFIPKGNLLDPFNIFGGRKDLESSKFRQEQQPLLAPGSTAQQQHPSGGSVGDIDGASQPAKTNNIASVGSSINPNADGRVPDGKPGTSYGVYPAMSNGTVIIDIPDKLDGTTQGTKHPQKPISEIVDGQNETNGQNLGGGDQFHPEERPVPTGTSQSTGIQTATERPLIAIEATGSKPLEILKSIVYGGLTESITSLSIVSSAAASEATALNIVALGLANLIGGLFVLFHNLKDLRYEETNEANEEVKSRYQKLLGRKENFLLHTIFAVLSYLVFGLIPPVVYGFTFHETDDRDFKMVAVAASALVCIVILAIAKAYTRGQHKFMAYSKTVLYYVTGAVMVSGVAYAVGHLFERLMVTLGWFDSTPVQHLLVPENKPWASF